MESVIDRGKSAIRMCMFTGREEIMKEERTEQDRG